MVTLFANHNHSLSYATISNKEVNPTYAEGLYGPNSSGFIATTEIEVLILIELNVFEIIEQEKHINIISSVLALRLKNTQMD